MSEYQYYEWQTIDRPLVAVDRVKSPHPIRLERSTRLSIAAIFQASSPPRWWVPSNGSPIRLRAIIMLQRNRGDICICTREIFPRFIGMYAAMIAHSQLGDKLLCRTSPYKIIIQCGNLTNYYPEW